MEEKSMEEKKETEKDNREAEKGNEEVEEPKSELRYDPSSDDWVVIASGRAKRPELFKKEEKKIERGDVGSSCPFCVFENVKNAVTSFENGREVGAITKNWTAVSIPNKFPAFTPADNLNEKLDNELYMSMDAVGYHEVVITRDHYKSIGQMSSSQASEVFKLYRKRYLALKDKKNVNYISIFHNHGSESGASVVHPHSQIITTPIVDMDLKRNLFNTKHYYENKQSCMYCDMSKEEVKDGRRVVYENDSFLVICPFASKAAFQIVVSPKKHLSYFEEITDTDTELLGDAFGKALSLLYDKLNNPSYNFYLHTAPCDGENYDYYHWHWTIVPKTSIWGGFELGARMEVSTIEPEKAAEYLRESDN
ncbi:MAG: galactose-1-phosphate uridylyltransferase [Candidatus Pacebacteria bacterium]|nr:galactose-1-phosphate uridylyltransferase [Candidatus Paceibacterota bacterium]